MSLRRPILSCSLLVSASLSAFCSQEPLIAPAANYSASLSSVQVADLNGDNAPEVLGLANNGSAVAVLRNLGNGKYSPATYYPITGQLNGIAIGDFNGDHRLDVAIAIGAYNAAHGEVAILLGNGDGSLQLPVYYSVPVPANSITVNDFNNDNRPDIAVVGNTNNNAINTVTILTNTGTSFTQHSFPAPTYFTPHGFGPDGDFVGSIVSGDFNGDGRIDLAYLDSCAQCDVSEEELFVLSNTPTGWQPRQPFGGTGSEGIRAADIDGDGITDFVIPFRGCHTPCVGVNVVYMDKNTAVANTQSLDVLDAQNGPTPSEVVVGDFNNDGITDIAGYSMGGTDQNFNQLPPGIMMWIGAGPRTFNKLKYYNQPSPASTFAPPFTAAGFLDSNGARDLVVPKGVNTQLWFNSTGTAADPCSYPLTGGVHVCAPAANVAAGTVRFLASARTNTQPLKRMELWIDGHKRFQVFSDRLHISLPVTNGKHAATFIEVGTSDLLIKKSVYFSVGTP